MAGQREYGKGGREKTSNCTVSLYENDQVMLDWLTAFLGSSKSDAFRTALRSYVGQMQSLAAREGIMVDPPD